MKKYHIALAASLMLGFSSCIDETLPTDHVLDSQIVIGAALVYTEKQLVTVYRGLKRIEPVHFRFAAKEPACGPFAGSL